MLLAKHPKSRHVFWLIIAILVAAFLVWLSYFSGRHGQSECGEDKGAIYGPAICVKSARQL